MEPYDLKKFEIDKKKLDKMKFQIIQEERQNVKTKAKTKDVMVDLVKSIIVDTVKQKY